MGLGSPNHFIYYMKFLNKHKVLTFFFFLFSYFIGFPQLVKVNDMLTQETLSDVYIFNENKLKYTLTDNNGIFDLKYFSEKTP